MRAKKGRSGKERIRDLTDSCVKNLILNLFAQFHKKFFEAF